MTTKEREPMERQDILGLALKDYLRGVRDETFVLRDDGLRSSEPIERYFKGYQDWCSVEQGLLARVEGVVLETGCCLGRHLSYLQARGLSAWGVDISPGAVELANQEGISHCLLMDARNLALEIKPDVILMLYYGFGLGGTIDGQRQLLRKLWDLSSDKAKIIASSIDALATNDPKHLQYQDFNRRKGKAAGDVTQVTLRLEHLRKKGEWYDLLFVNPKGIKTLIEGTGWKAQEIIAEKPGGRGWYYVLSKELES